MRQIPLAVGEVVAGRYRVERVLGYGGMGVVVAARHIELDEVFALKVMTAEAFESPESVERFVREARTTAKLRSVHAVKVVDTGRLHDGAPFLAMEYLQGRDLEKELAARGPLPAAEAAGYVMQACDVLAEAHALGIVHRDLKPANLFLTRLPNGASCVKVLDFGIAKSDHAQGPRMTQTSSVFGTPLYMSPEQMRSSKSADPRSDIWSLGVVLYELCTGAVPYDGESMTALVAIVMTELPVPPSRRRPGIGADIEGVIMRCLQRDPAQRYPTAAALAQALAPIAQGYRPAQQSFPDPSWAPHANAPSGSSPFTQPWSTGQSQPNASAPSVSGITGPTWAPSGTQSALTTSTPARSTRSATPIVLGAAAAIALGGALATFFVLRGSHADPQVNAAPLDPGSATAAAPVVSAAPAATASDATPPSAAPNAATASPEAPTASPSTEVSAPAATASPEAPTASPSTEVSAPAATASPKAVAGSASPKAATTSRPVSAPATPATAATSKPAPKPSSKPNAGRGGFL